MSFWYMASTYTSYPDGRDAAYREVSKAAAQLLAQGIPVFSPIAHGHSLAEHGDGLPLMHEFWMNADAPFMAAAYGIIVLKLAGWFESRGINEEIEIFRAANKPVCWMDWSES